MTDKEKIQKTFEKLHASPKILTEVLDMTTDNKVVLISNKSKRYSKRRGAIVAVIACMMIGTVACATGRIATYFSWSRPQDVITSYSKALKKSDNLGCDITIPEQFFNGYVFKSANEKHYKGIDENKNVLAKGEDFTATYVKDNNPDIYFYVQTIYTEEENPYEVNSRIIGNIKVSLNHAFYKFVPADYELTEKDKQNEKSPNYEISYGSDQIEETTFDGISFEKDGKRYDMFAWNSSIPADDWYLMAEELLD